MDGESNDITGKSDESKQATHPDSTIPKPRPNHHTGKDLLWNPNLMNYASRFSSHKQIPDEVWTRSNILLKLDVEFNNISELPEALSSLVNLTSLVIAHNEFTMLSDTPISQMTKLKHLDLSFNFLTALPSGVSTLVNLEELIVTKNQLQTFPTQVYELSQLKILHLGGNPSIGTVPKTFCKSPYPNLTELRLSELGLAELPTSFSKLTSLTFLNLDINRFRQWPEPLTHLTSLKSINFSLNDFTELPSGDTVKQTYPGISSVDFSGCSIDLTELQFVPSPFKVCTLSKPNLIVPGLYLGNIETCYNKHYLKSQGITHVLSIIENDAPYPWLFTYKVIKIPDLPTTDIYQYFEDCIIFINEAIDTGGACLVHCAAGISRSATVVTAWVMKRYRLRFNDALDYVLDKRPIVNPNDGFLEQLKRWESNLESENTKFRKIGSQPSVAPDRKESCIIN